MHIRRLTLAMSGVLVALGLSATPAFASSTPPAPRFGGTWNVTKSITGSSVYAQYGAAGEIDDGYICDTAADGHHAHVDIGNIGDSRTNINAIRLTKDDFAGANTCVEFYDMSGGSWKLFTHVATMEGSTIIDDWLLPTYTSMFADGDSYTSIARSSGAETIAKPSCFDCPSYPIWVCDVAADGHHASGNLWARDSHDGTWWIYAVGSEFDGANTCTVIGTLVHPGIDALQTSSWTAEGSTTVSGPYWSAVVPNP